MKVKIIARKAYHNTGCDFFVYAEDANGKMYKANPIKLVFEKEPTEPQFIAEPTFAVNLECEFDVNDINPRIESATIDAKKEHIQNLNEIIKLVVMK